MKILLLLLLLISTVGAQDSTVWFTGKISFEPVITDSIVWHVSGIINIGDPVCQHTWVNSEKTMPNLGQSCCVFHNGFHCDWDDAIYSRICRKCMRKETLRETWYQHRQIKSKSPYDSLNDKLIKKWTAEGDTLLPFTKMPIIK